MQTLLITVFNKCYIKLTQRTPKKMHTARTIICSGHRRRHEARTSLQKLASLTTLHPSLLAATIDMPEIRQS